MRSPLCLLCLFTMSCGSRQVASTTDPVLPPEPRVVVPREPPPGRVEVVPPQPLSDTVWIDGTWDWIDRRWVWTKGGWVIPPAGATYFTWRIVRATDAQLYFSPTVWRDPKGNLVNAPSPLATATVTTVPIVNPDGTQARTVTKQD